MLYRESQSKLIALEKAWNRAYKEGDVNSLESLLDDSVVLINDDGSVQTKAETRILRDMEWEKPHGSAAFRVSTRIDYVRAQMLS